MSKRDNVVSYLEDINSAVATVQTRINEQESYKEKLESRLDKLTDNPGDSKAKEDVEDILRFAAGTHQTMADTAKTVAKKLKNTESVAKKAEEDLYQQIIQMLEYFRDFYRNLRNEAAAVAEWYADRAEEVAEQDGVDQGFLQDLKEGAEEWHTRMTELYQDNIASREDGSLEDIRNQLRQAQRGEDSGIQQETAAAIDSMFSQTLFGLDSGVENFTKLQQDLIQLNANAADSLQKAQAAADSVADKPLEVVAFVVLALVVACFATCATRSIFPPEKYTLDK